jgi:Phage integrase, N-terminal SAM-like domain
MDDADGEVEIITAGLGTGHPLARHIGDFLADLRNQNSPAHTRPAYRGDLLQFAAHHGEEISELTARPVRACLAEITGLAPSTRKRKRAAVASFCKWAVRHDPLAEPDGQDRHDQRPQDATPARRCGRRCEGLEHNLSRPRPPTVTLARLLHDPG